jgi:hypothetical protein
MKFRSLLFVPWWVPMTLSAQDRAVPRELMIAAVGEIPVPKMKVTEVMGRRGYEADPDSTDQWFPKAWTVAGKKIALALNGEPAAMKLTAGMMEVSVAPEGANAKLQALPAAADGPTLLLIFNREPDKAWNDGFGVRFLSCSKLDSTVPTATVFNLSGATLSLTQRDRSTLQLAPGKSALAPVFVQPQSGIKLLPLAANAAGKSYSLDVTPLEVRSPWCPVVIVYPSTGPSSKTRPLKVSVIQPSAAVRVDPPASAAGN